jgi:hypothetical protein
LQRDAKSGDRTTVNPLDEFLFRQGGKCWTFVTKDASKRVRDALSHSVDALLKVDEFPLDL